MLSLSSLFYEHCGNISDKWEHYLAIYEAELARFRDAGRPIKLLEIGVQNGGSLQVFAKYLPEGSSILGLDVDPACARLSLGPNIRVAIADASVPAAVDAALGDERFDLIVDDGSHHSDQIIATFRACFDRLDPGGLYIVEDLHASYWASHGGGFRRDDSATERLKALVDALNIDHIPSGTSAQINKMELDWMQQAGAQLARLTFYDSIAVLEKLSDSKRGPYRRLLTGRCAPVSDPATQIEHLSVPQLRNLILAPATAEVIAPALLEAVVTAREEVGCLRSKIAGVEQHLAKAREDLAESVKAEQHLAITLKESEKHLDQARRDRVEAEEHRVVAAGRAAELERALARAREEQDHLLRKLDYVLGSTFWRITGPARRIVSILPPGLRRQCRRGARIVYWILTPHRTHERIAYFRERQANAPMLAKQDVAPNTVSAEKPAVHPPATSHLPAYDRLLREHFGNLEPLRTFEAPHDGPRVTIVTDSVSSGSLYGGVGTAIILGALLAQRLAAGLRLVTRSEPPIASNIGMILRTHGISWTGNVECLHSAPGSGGHDVPVTRDDLFLTTSWWTTRATRGAVPPAQIIYMVGEDERMFYPMGDDHLLCSETLSDPALLYCVNSNLLLRHLQSEGMTPNGVSFEPAFPEGIYHAQQLQTLGARRNFFFYARPNNLRNLYWRGLNAIAGALEEGVFDPDKWDFYFVGKDNPELALPRGVCPRVIHYLPWPDYAALTRRIDVGLSLMYTPHPSYPPLDLAASGAVVVTNRFGSKFDLSGYSRNILCVDPSIQALVAGLRQAVALSEDKERRAANAIQFGMPRDWVSALAPVLDSVAERRRKG